MRHLRVALLLALGLALGAIGDLTPGHAYAATLPTRYTLTYTSLATANSPTYTPQRPHLGVAIFVRATQAGTFQVQQYDGNGNWNALGAARAATAGTQDQHIIDYPIAGQLRVQYINTSGLSGTALVEIIDKAAI